MYSEILASSWVIWIIDHLLKKIQQVFWKRPVMKNFYHHHIQPYQQILKNRAVNGYSK